MKNKRTISFLVCALLVFGICTPLVSADTAQELEEALISEEMAIAMELEAKAKAEKEAYNTYPEEEVYTIGAEENAFESEEFVADNGSESEDVATSAVTSFNTQDMLAWGENISWKFEDGYLGVEGTGAFPEGISPWAQYYYNDIYEAIILEGITYIGDDAFANCHNLSVIYMPDSVEYISERAFVGAADQGYLVFVCSPDSYACKFALSHGIFVEAEGLYDMPLSQGNIDGVSWELWADGSLFITGNGEIPDFLTEFAPWHEYCDLVKTVEIRTGIEKIGEFAFQDCVNLDDVYISASVKEIAPGAFFDLDFENMMVYCDENTAAEDFVTEHSIPAEITRKSTNGNIGENITWELSDGVLTLSGEGDMEDYAFFGFTYNKVQKIVVNEGITSIGANSFVGFAYVTEVELADSIETIEHGAFNMCRSIETLKLPESLRVIEDQAFSECCSLKEVDFPEGLEKIGKCAFECCEELETVNLLTRIERIDDQAFSLCTKLSGVFIPSSVRRLGDYIFNECAEDLVIHGLAGTKVEEYADEYGIDFEEIPVIVEEDPCLTVPAIKEEAPKRELTGIEKVVEIIADNIIFILIGLCAIVAAVFALIVALKIKGVKKAKAAKKQAKTE